ncbi:hypothetical protein PUNSTDRAFT_137835 [Punctularia strigosozonata HHB-11173 SS5]|uniref:Uncharacterized protein n=1 Tax=Punctularia strigosozonata (strain HHB-11173) TaxID=741275 RepID=R7S5B7_PUNST|nr:uncharacterized protein PUNSTDRAFT_137835 [Punctularia strigosozonata HHB-11173 SS5]EIN05154.1 hypothetical protein PUNSTDRAFT_137835 [Punctularia strigosozonata HHB-11173 SS5]
MNSVNDFSTGWQTVSEAAMEAKLWDIAEVLIEPPPQPGQENGTQLRSASDTSQTEPFVRERPPHSEINADEDAHSKSNRTANMEQMRPNESERHNKGERRNERDEWLPPAPSRVSEALDILQDRELLVWARNDVDSPALATRQDAVIVSGQSDGYVLARAAGGGGMMFSYLRHAKARSEFPGHSVRGSIGSPEVARQTVAWNCWRASSK